MSSFWIAGNLFKRILGSPKGWIGYIIVPAVIVSLIVSFAGKEPTSKVTIAYSKNDQGELGNYVIKELENKDDYKLVQLSETEMKAQIISRDIPVGFVIPSSFSEQLINGEEIKVEKFELNVSEASFTLGVTINQTIGQLESSIGMVKASGIQEDQLMTTVLKVFDQQAEHRVKAVVVEKQTYISGMLFLIIGFMLFFLMNLITSSLGFVLEDRKQMTMARIYTAPVRSFEIALGNLLGSFGLGSMQLLIILIITKYVLGFNYGVPFLPLFIILATFLLAVVGIASAVAGLVKNSNNLSAINSLVITPTCMLGGCWWPIGIMPDFMQKVANFVPQKWAIDGVLRMTEGESIFQIGINLGILVLFGLIFLGFGSVVLKPSEEGV